MTETRAYLANATLQLQKNDDAAPPPPSLNADKASHAEESDLEGKYVAVSPNGTHVTRKGPGSITIQFRSGEIICVEAVAKKTYRNP